MTSCTSEPVWNSLEIAKLIVSGLVPIAIVMLGIWVRHFTEAIDRRGKLSQIEIEWRLQVFKELGPKLNMLYCYFNYVGDWKEITPQEAVATKRECDRIVYTNRFLWSKDFLSAYSNFTTAAFEEARGPGLDLALRANRNMHRKNPKWEDGWDNYFVDPESRIQRVDFIKFYDAVLSGAVKDLALKT